MTLLYIKPVSVEWHLDFLFFVIIHLDRCTEMCRPGQQEQIISRLWKGKIPFSPFFKFVLMDFRAEKNLHLDFLVVFSLNTFAHFACFGDGNTHTFTFFFFFLTDF